MKGSRQEQALAELLLSTKIITKLESDIETLKHELLVEKMKMQAIHKKYEINPSGNIVRWRNLSNQDFEGKAYDHKWTWTVKILHAFYANGNSLTTEQITNYIDGHEEGRVTRSKIVRSVSATLTQDMKRNKYVRYKESKGHFKYAPVDYCDANLNVMERYR